MLQRLLVSLRETEISHLYSQPSLEYLHMYACFWCNVLRVFSLNHSRPVTFQRLTTENWVDRTVVHSRASTLTSIQLDSQRSPKVKCHSVQAFVLSGVILPLYIPNYFPHVHQTCLIASLKLILKNHFILLWLQEALVTSYGDRHFYMQKWRIQVSRFDELIFIVSFLKILFEWFAITKIHPKISE